MNEMTCAKCGNGQFGIYHRKSDLACAIFNGPYLMGYHETNRFTPSTAPVGGECIAQPDPYGLPDLVEPVGPPCDNPCCDCNYPATPDREAKARKVAEDLGPEIKSQAAQAEPALPRKAQVSQEAEECKVGAAILADLKVWLEFRLQTVEHQEPDRRPYPPTGHEQDSYSVVPIPEWETRQKLDAITAALLQFSAKDL